MANTCRDHGNSIIASEFSKVDVILELLQNKENISHSDNMISHLFKLLSQLVEVDRTQRWSKCFRSPYILIQFVDSSVEYTVQLLLTALTRFVTELSSKGSGSFKDIEPQLDLGLVIHCLRSK